MGGNDVRDALDLLTPNLVASLAHLDDAVSAIRKNIERLHYAGARRFFVWNAPDLGVTPAIRALDPLLPVDLASVATFLSGYFNFQLGMMLSDLESGPDALPGFSYITFDAFAKLGAIVQSPALFGLSDAETPCIQPNVPPFRCRHPNRHFFWDGIHPTRAGHDVIADLALMTLLESLIQH
jgi:phospholipase/lecithinase/hemolysin